MNLPNMKDAKIRTNNKVETYYDKYNVSELVSNYGFGKKYFIETYGCQMNVHDSENISAIMEDMSFTKTNIMDDADVIILNTCAIRENAHNKVFGMLGRIKHLKESKPNIITCLCGCMAQEETVTNKLLDKKNIVDIVFGTHNIYELPSLLENYINTNVPNVVVYSNEGEIIENIPVRRDSKYKAWVNIMYGCDKFCTYCIVPFTRGKQRSRKSSDIIMEVEELINNGYKEVTLLGQNVNAYGKDLDVNYNMANLLSDVAKTGIDRIRFVTSHPWDFTDEMIEVISNYSNVMPYIHLPVQSGSNKILKLMGRKYTRESYIELFNKIKNSVSNVSITTDIIVGFPGEEKEDFEETISLVNELKFDLAYTFIFSPRENTVAANLTNQVDDNIKKERLQILNGLINKYAKENNDKYDGKVTNVLIDSLSNKEGYLSGYTDTMKLVNIKCDNDYLGKIVSVKITKVKTWSMDGELI